MKSRLVTREATGDGGKEALTVAQCSNGMKLPPLFFSQLAPVHAAWRAGFAPSTGRQVSLALQCVQETILSAETVPWLTTTSQDPNPEQVMGKG